MKRFLLVALPIVVLVLFVLIMNSAFLFKDPSVTEQIESIRQGLLSGKWDVVSDEVSALDSNLKKNIFPFIQFSAEREELIRIKTNISRLKSCLDSKDKSLALAEVYELRGNWDNLYD
jgi:hypothetical protein